MPPRKAVEVMPDGTEVKVGIWYGNTKARQDKLTSEQLAGLAGLGVPWAQPAAPAQPAPPTAATEPPTPPPAPNKQPDREHHEECDEELYEGGNCTCWSIKRFGPPSEREGYGDDF
ncbi:hypothetical protein [Streptomyces halstedii]|uniref:hypothetical protein n=1 Tax=Streptomyces halstedii TaxID=1944 RepID=UPI00380130A1